jgi:endonuclease G
MRQDIEEIADRKLARAIKKRRPERPRRVAEVEDIEALIDVRREEAPRIQVRKSLIETEDRDPNGLERVLGISDLCSINFLARGLEAAKAIARIRVRRADGSGEWYGTGFLVAPGLLLTNHHVLANEDQAALAVAEFNFQHDLHGVESPRRAYNLAPSRLFFTDSGLDCSLVEVAPRSFDGTPLTEFGYLPLMQASGKAIDGEWVSIIQHPGGQPKQIAIRDSQVVRLTSEDAVNIDVDSFIHYTTDSEPGSSGAPVLNDQWQVVALHHRGVPDFNEKGQRLARDGKTVWTKEMGEEQKGWIANEGVRVSAIYRLLQSKQFESLHARAALARLRYGFAVGKRTLLSVIGPLAAEVELEAQGADSQASFFQGVDGYDRDFLSKRIPLPTDDTRKSKQAKLNGANSTVLKYTHFSVVFDSERRFARFTAVNIDGSQLIRNSGVTKPWRRDARIDVEIQPDDDFYVKSIAVEKVYFQRGHLVRRVDPSWGTAPEAKRAVEDTFHFTNAAPHVGAFNDTIWGNLEDYLLDKCDKTLKRMTVFSGPIFRSTDPSNYGATRPNGPYTIPVDYWKVAVIQKTATTIAAAGFVVGHGNLVDALHAEELVFAGLHPYSPSELVDNGIQTTIETIEGETGLDFGDLKDFDSVAGLEATFHSRPLRTFADIII